MQRPVVFKSNGSDVYGVLHLPEKISPRRPIPGVVLCHGFTGTKVEAHRIFVKMAWALERYGIASVRFDYRGCGDSEGDFVDATVGGHIEDAMRAVDFIISQPGIDKGKIGILGFSLGGAVASYVAGRANIKALALWAPAADLMEEAEQYQKENDLKGVKRLRAVDYCGNLIGRHFAKELPEIQPLLEIEKYNGPAIIVHGTKDESVPLSHSLRFYRVLKKKNLPVTRCLVEGSDHAFSSYQWEREAIKRTLRFFVRNL